MENKANKKDLVDVLSEILKWTKFIGKQQLRALLLNALKDDVEKIIYELSDGKSLREIAKISKSNGYAIGYVTINNYWDKWAPLGIVEPSSQFKGRYERIVSLKEVGIDFPPIKISKKKGKGK